MEENSGSGCVICHSKSSREDHENRILRTHVEDVIDIKPQGKVKEDPLTCEDDVEQVVIKCDKPEGLKNEVPLKLFLMNGILKDGLNKNMKLIHKLGKRRNESRIHIERILDNLQRRDLLQELNKDNYFHRFHNLLWMEEHYAQKDLARHNQRDVTLLTSTESGTLPSLYGIDVVGISDGRPTLIINDTVRIHKKYDFVEDRNKNLREKVFEGRVDRINKEEDKIYVAPNANKFVYTKEEKVDVEFVLNRRPYRLSHRALEQLENNETLHENTLFPKKSKPKANKPPTSKEKKQSKQTEEKSKPKKDDLDFVNKKISTDEKQKKAIENIIDKSSGSTPYLLIGPPGTGKTATLIEAIYQIWKRSLKSQGELPKICICAPSNPAIDVIVKRLLGRDKLENDRLRPPFNLEKNVIRVYAKTREKDPDILDCSTTDVDKHFLEKKRIIATTTTSAGRLIDKGFGRNWFDYLFIDEAGQSTETNILIPIAGFVHDKCYLVLAGDPKQLGPVVISPLATELGLDVSLMERLKNESIYQRRSNRNSFLFTTTLNNNYRSHPRIIYIPNRHFYDGQLRIKGQANKIFVASDSDWKELNKRNKPRFPIIFQAVKGIELWDGYSPSFFNVKEIIQVKYYVDELLGASLNGHIVVPEDIGIISPYRNQVEKIKKYMNHRKIGEKSWDGITVGSIESFQGSEKLIVIISTVRTKGLGFLKNERRFNVAITRAMALLIVIGHPEVLYRECDNGGTNYWRELIKYCHTFHSCKGLPAELKTRT